MNDVFAITTHHDEPVDAAEAWKRNGVCAIGFIRKRNLRHIKRTRFNRDIRLFLEIDKHDLILAYATRNMIAYVGQVIDGKCLYNDRNEVGDTSRFDYPNQLRVKWWSEPHHFQRTDLPQFFSAQLGKRGKTVVKLDLGSYSFGKAVEAIRACANSNSAATGPDEDMIKIGLHSYLDRNRDFIRGLKIRKAEVQITPENRPDFVGVDASGRKVLIECKGTATASACDQLMRYKKAHGGRSRLILVAFRIDDECKRQARRNGIELIQCALTPQRHYK